MRRLALGIALCAAACAPPTERSTRVRATTPLLAEPEDDALPSAALHEGELVLATPSDRPPLDWRARFDGAEAHRAGPLLEVRRAAGETRSFAFASDLDAVAARDTPTAAWLCERMHGSAACPTTLRR